MTEYTYIEPFSDDDLVFKNNKYYATQNACLQRGINLDSITTNEADQTALIYLATNLVYTFVHKFNQNTKRQDWFIAHAKELREVMSEVLPMQIGYLLSVGYLGYSLDQNQRQYQVDDLVKQMLIDSGICYSGVI